MVKSKKVSVDVIKNLVTNWNNLLAMEISQEAKSTICCQIESLLMDVNAYGGFNHLYWLDGGGTDAWYAAGQPDFDNGKMKFLIGPNGVASNKDPNFVSAIEGEYSRCYWAKALAFE